MDLSLHDSILMTLPVDELVTEIQIAPMNGTWMLTEVSRFNLIMALLVSYCYVPPDLDSEMC